MGWVFRYLEEVGMVQVGVAGELEQDEPTEAWDSFPVRVKVSVLLPRSC